MQPGHGRSSLQGFARGTEHYKRERLDGFSLVQFDGQQARSLRLIRGLLILDLRRPPRKLAAGVEVTLWLKAESAEFNSVIIIGVQIHDLRHRLHGQV